MKRSVQGLQAKAVEKTVQRTKIDLQLKKNQFAPPEQPTIKDGGSRERNASPISLSKP